MTKVFKQEVLSAFKKVSPSKIGIEDEVEFAKYIHSQHNLYLYKLKFPPDLFRNKKIIDFGCGTGEMDFVFAGWGAQVKGFDFNDLSISRANSLKKSLSSSFDVKFEQGDVDDYPVEPESYDITVSLGVIAHVPDQENMFRRMVHATRNGGFIILGYIEDSGLIQRLLHRVIVKANSDKSDDEVFKIAKEYFSEHIDRSVKFGGRTAESVINDYLVNPHYIGISSQKLFSWAKIYGIEYYSAWPNIDLPFTVDSPYSKLIEKDNPVYSLYFSLLRLRWLYAQDEDESVLSELVKLTPDLDSKIESFFESLNCMLQHYDLSGKRLNDVSDKLHVLEIELSKASVAFNEILAKQFSDLNSELLRILEMVNLKIEKGVDFNLNNLSKKLFRGYNGLGTSYVIFHKP